MNLIENVLQNWSSYELITEGVLILSILLLSLVAIYIFSKSKKILALSAISLLVLMLVILIGIFLVDTVLKIHVTQIFRMIPILSLLFNLSNLGVLLGFYTSKKNTKSFKFSLIRREYLKDSVKQTVFLTLLGISTLLFLSPQTEVVLSISMLSSIVTIWITFWISKYFLK
jgi:hypothetical protein